MTNDTEEINGEMEKSDKRLIMEILKILLGPRLCLCGFVVIMLVTSGYTRTHVCRVAPRSATGWKALSKFLGA